MNSKKLAQLAVTALDDMKGQSISSINVRKLTDITDYMVIATGRSNTHVKALSDEVVRQVKDAGGKVVGVEGRMQSEWVLVDLGDVVVHIMLAPVRALYNLEDLWNFQATASEDEKGSGRSS
ncbi:MAG: ribosome silencing factor [Pseudohongiellaceae bacterium]